jgi:dipeptidyl aminopeptidase/acylaminoacyl peptidase
MHGSKASVTPPGQWPSEISASLVAQGSTRLAEPRLHKEKCYWLESLNHEKGRMSLMCDGDNEPLSILPAPYSIRSKVHEYGGNAYCFLGDEVCFVNAEDQQIYRLKPEGDIFQLSRASDMRFADLHPHPKLPLLVAVAEQHCPNEIRNLLIAINVDTGDLTILRDNADFFAYPRFNPSGDKLCWVSWNQPDMPWDSTQLWFAEFGNGTLSSINQVPSPQAESVVQPEWRNDDELLFISDRDNWWNVFSHDTRKNHTHCICEKRAEFATPLWTLGMSNYCLLGSHTALVSYTSEGLWHAAELNIETGALSLIRSSLNTFHSFSRGDNSAIMVAAGASQAPGIWLYRHKQLSQIRASTSIDPKLVSKADIVSFSTQAGEIAHAFYYPPLNPKCHSDEPPPLIVLCHGGPTGQSDASLNLKIQFWTSRGFAVADVNYRGSTGYGRKYRQSLYGHWGVKDVQDVVTAAQALVKQGRADPEKLIIKGSSAGGYTVLAALTFADTFKVGVSLYGIGDLELLAQHTHKFEARYLDQLVGPYPQQKALYLKRSPIHHSKKLDCAMLLFQGLEDKVVPPEQAQLMAQAVRDKNLPVCLIEYADEGHGFRSTENIEHMLNSELSFYQRVLQLGDSSGAEIEIDNL